MNLPSTPALLAACSLGLVLTLALAARLTPAHWWRRPNLRALALAAGGALGFGLLLAPLLGGLFAGPGTAAPLAVPLAAPLLSAPESSEKSAPARGAAYLVVADLNLRLDEGTGAPRVTVLRAGSRVTASGARRGDWWRVRARAGGRELEGWASSLWLRRIDEGARAEP